ncbi:precorrin-2 dehydrogenase / sirohydrochlorin ferrochelatase [Sulfobacillus thermosulfidooxidans DSM 9293]|uniref:precorrin-2 dehydrogenase n=1 Tax=Sulfobacillus thermosulfidooxidans (strain DSM 9293 / VKM B-1269 / AT-1) TaxID=929705 RepID=A0A1W1WI08_SULTA|nr:NAD(P)-dependent oxidoreductase [Sulfobacillus thermosulfidooxidans]SMC05886.1 precorrin-2 dehydrogenase / sirohydrochlorin ferrochelatase [Sulfobacillus thermosulfidooxidans DSM 9293]
MSALPIAIELERQKVLIIGTGALAHERIVSLLDTGAVVELYGSRDPDSPVESDIREGRVSYYHRDVCEQDFVGAKLVFVTDIHRLSPHIAVIQKWAHQHHAWLHVADVPSLCDFYAVSQLRRGDLVIGISTSGKAPSLAKQVRLALENLFDGSWAPLVSKLYYYRCQRSEQASSVKRAHLQQWAQHYVHKHLVSRIVRAQGEMDPAYSDIPCWQEEMP